MNIKANSISHVTTLISFGVLLLSGQCLAQEESLEDYTARLQDIFQMEFDNQVETSALWIGIADPDYGDLYFVLGNATGGPPADTPAALEQRFDIGSISKTMGGTTIMRLAEQGVLSLQDTVEALVPDFAMSFPEYANYTVEELLRMKTIVPDFLNDPDGLLNDYSQDITKRYSPEDIVTYALQKYPAEMGTYSTTNFIVLDVIAEAVANTSILDLVQELVFDPLGMTHSVFPDRYSDGVHPEPRATPYAGPACVGEFNSTGYDDVEVYDDITEFSQGIVMAGTGGAINSNIEDLLKWAKSGTGDDLLSAEMVERRHVYDSVIEYGNLEYGMAQYRYAGFMEAIEPFYNGWYGHNGDAFGFGANAFKNDQFNVSVASGINTCGSTAMHDMVIKVVTDELSARTGEASGTMTPTVDGDEAAAADNGTMTDQVPEETLTPTTEAPVDNGGSEEATTTDAPESSAVGLSLRCVAAMAMAILWAVPV